jgi:hypothetical protein
MERSLATPDFPLKAKLFLLGAVFIELGVYGVIVGVPAVWVMLVLGAFYLAYVSLFRRDALPVTFALLFLTAYHSLAFYLEHNLQIAVLFMIIFTLNSIIMWFLLHFATHIKTEYHTAYSFISGFMIAQLLTLYATMVHDWPFRFELAAYISTLFSYIFWRFACLSSEAMLNWRQFLRVIVVVIILLIIIIIASPNVPV